MDLQAQAQYFAETEIVVNSPNTLVRCILVVITSLTLPFSGHSAGLSPSSLFYVQRNFLPQRSIRERIDNKGDNCAP